MRKLIVLLVIVLQMLVVISCSDNESNNSSEIDLSNNTMIEEHNTTNENKSTNDNDGTNDNDIINDYDITIKESGDVNGNLMIINYSPNKSRFVKYVIGNSTSDSYDIFDSIYSSKGDLIAEVIQSNYYSESTAENLVWLSETRLLIDGKLILYMLV